MAGTSTSEYVPGNGNESTKVVLKHPCVMRAYSVKSVTLLAILTGAKAVLVALEEPGTVPEPGYNVTTKDLVLFLW